MPRRIILVDCYWTRDKDPRVPLGHASLLTALERRTDVETEPFVVPVDDDQNSVKRHSPAKIVSRILSLRGDHPDSEVDIAIGAYVWAEALIQEVLPLLRRRGFTGRIVMGGPQISYQGAGLEEIYPQADVFIRGYGEDALCKLVATPEQQDIQGVHYAGSEDLVQQASIDFTALPSPFLEGIIDVSNQPFIRWETQRGCGYKCAFCQHREAGGRLAHRSFDVGRLMREIELFCKAGVRDIAVLDPIFNSAKHAPLVLEKFIELGFDGHLSLQCRAEEVTPEFLALVEQLDVTLEFGLQTIHQDEQDAIRRNNHMPKVKRVLADVRRRGLKHEVSLIFGLPHQTLNSFMQTVEWCLQRRIPVIKAWPLMLLRGTPMEENRDQWGLVTDGHAMPKVIASDTFTTFEWHMMASLSDALKATEGNHPTRIETLLTRADLLTPNLTRWQPSKLQEAV